MRHISPHSVRMRENTDQKTFEYEHFSRSSRVFNRIEQCCTKATPNIKTFFRLIVSLTLLSYEESTCSVVLHNSFYEDICIIQKKAPVDHSFFGKVSQCFDLSNGSCNINVIVLEIW